MSVALKLYDQLTEAGENRERARLIAEAFEKLEERYPLKEMATHGHVRESELRLQKEIKEVEAKLQKEIKDVDLKISEVEARLQKEIKDVDLKINKLQLEIKEAEGRLMKEIRDLEIRMVSALHRQTLWIIGSVGAIIGAIRLLDVFLRASALH